MSNTFYGQIPEFYGDGDDWNVYYERLDQFFAVNDISEEKRSAFLISVIGSYTYKTLRDLCHPVLPKDKPFEELCELLRRQFSPQVSIFRERSKFYNAKQENFETVSAWYAKVKKLSVDCSFGTNLDLILLDKFITGLRSGPILDRLCEENETLTLRQALEIAVNKESALALEIPPTTENNNCFECCVPPPVESKEIQTINDDNDNIPDSPPSSAAGDSGFKEPQISRCPPLREAIFQRQLEEFNQPSAEVIKQQPIRCRRTSKALLGKPIGSPMAEMPSRSFESVPPGLMMEMPHYAVESAPVPPMAEMPQYAAESAPVPPMARAMCAAPMLDMQPVMKKTLIENTNEVEDDVQPVFGDQEKKKKTRRGCRGGRKNKKRTETE